MSKKKKKEGGQYTRVIVGVITRTPIINGSRIVRIGYGSGLATNGVPFNAVAFTRNLTGLADVNNNGPGSLKPSIIVTFAASNEDTVVEEYYVIEDKDIECIIYREVPVIPDAEEIQMSMEQ